MEQLYEFPFSSSARARFELSAFIGTDDKQRGQLVASRDLCKCENNGKGSSSSSRMLLVGLLNWLEPK